MIHESSCWLDQDMSQPREVISAHLFEDDTEISRANSPGSQAEERRVYQDYCRKISKHGTLLSQRHDPVHAD